MVDPLSNRRIILAAYPEREVAECHFVIDIQPLPQITEGQFLVRNRWLSLDPMVRIFIDPCPMNGTIAPLSLGAVIPGAASGTVVASRHPDFATGDAVEGRFGWQDYAVSQGAGVRRLDPSSASIEDSLGIFGLPGFSAYVGLKLAGGVTAGKTVIINGAAGAVGSMAGALVRAWGGQAIGIARGEEKRRLLVEELGFHHAVDRGRGQVAEQLAEILPDGADIYFDNVGGPMFVKVSSTLRRGATIVICGLMAHYQRGGEASPEGIGDVLGTIMARGLTVRAFSNIEHEALRPAFQAEVAELVRTGRITSRNTIIDGIEKLPAAFVGMFREGVVGKLLVRLQ